MVSLVVFGGLVLFAAYAMAHFIHEWRDARRRDGSASPDDQPPER